MAQSLQEVAALKQRHDASLGILVGDIHELLRRPGEILFLQIDAGKRIAVVRVKARGNDDQLGAEITQPGKNAALEGGAESLTVVAGPQRRVDDAVVLAGFADRTGARKQ